jgi:hypothetical protein
MNCTCVLVHNYISTFYLIVAYFIRVEYKQEHCIAYLRKRMAQSPKNRIKGGGRFY